MAQTYKFASKVIVQESLITKILNLVSKEILMLVLMVNILKTTKPFLQNQVVGIFILFFKLGLYKWLCYFPRYCEFEIFHNESMV